MCYRYALLSFAVLLFSGSTHAAPSAKFDFLPTRHVEGRISVPLDWRRTSAGEKIWITYRAYDLDNAKKPFLFVVGGGPGVESIPTYHRMSVGHAEDNEYGGYSKYFRVVLFDQRGTGRSTPLNKASMNPKDVFTHFNTLNHAWDLAELIRTLVPVGDKFFLASHSSGGDVAVQYLAQRTLSDPRPRGLILLSSIIGPVDGQDLFNERMRFQIEANEKTIGQNPVLKKRILAAKKKIRRIAALANDPTKLHPNAFDGHFDAVHPQGLALHTIKRWADEVLNRKVRTPEQVTKILGSQELFSDPLVYILDWRFSKSVSQPELFANLPEDLKKRIRPWMLLEHRMLLSQENQMLFPAAQRAFFERTDQELKGVDNSLMGKEAIQSVLNKIPVLSLAPDADAFVPHWLVKKSLEDLELTSPHHFEVVEKGMIWVTLSEFVADYVWTKIQELEGQLKAESGLDCGPAL